MEATSTRKTKYIAWLLIGLGIIGLVIGLWVFFRQSVSSNPVNTPSLESPPSSKKPSQQEIQTYSVSPSSPKYISIPSIGVDDSRVIKLGTLSNNQIASPRNIYDAGWYSSSARPGQKGAVFIYGHVSSWQAAGIFHNLKKLKPGDRIIITRGDGQKFTYEVKATKTYDAKQVNMDEVLKPIDPNKPGLNLMTCSGHIIKGTSEFSERLVVFTSLVK